MRKEIKDVNDQLLVDTFYERVAGDELLAPIFQGRIKEYAFPFEQDVHILERPYRGIILRSTNFAAARVAMAAFVERSNSQPPTPISMESPD